MSALQAPQVSISGFPFVPYSHGPFGNFQLFFLFKVKGKGIFPDLKDVGSAVIGVGVGRIRRTIGAAVNGGRDNMRCGELGAGPTPPPTSTPCLLDLVCLWASCLGLGYPLTTSSFLGLLSAQHNKHTGSKLGSQSRDGASPGLGSMLQLGGGGGGGEKSIFSSSSCLFGSSLPLSG